MLENQIVQKSSEISGDHSGPEFVQESTKIYFDPQQAIADFDAEVPEVKEERITDPRVANFIRHAQVLMKHREYPLAMNLLREASNKDSKNPATLNMLANCLDKMSRSSEALIVRKTLAQVDYGFESLHGYATSLYKSGRDQEALDKYFEALAVLTDETGTLFETYKNMGNIFVRQGDFDGAEEYYNKAYTMNPQSDVLLVNFGTLEVQRGDYDKSLYCFRKAVEINPENDKAWVGLAMVHSQFGDMELAWANIETAIDINPQNRTAVHLAANWGLRDGKLQKAIEALQGYLASVEEDEDMSLVLINLLCSAGQVDQAMLEIERVLLWNPDHAEVRSLKKKIIASQKVA
ncbi:tetratricopeptide repeat protein [Bdellovibrio bacteriovorus]|uniref:O-linked GlcNAc transferase n=1 Tax=Bdellovibrio bacteriovorus TaxID=959 RepID=A0A1Z3NBJ4_BDEBC|nr:tetratricopeptide repeat protein [Bdellovibrio bacteriovorus]ASD64839.1 O-linked GlcNAc transferase [Bdellovibrio bacteriovorus]